MSKVPAGGDGQVERKTAEEVFWEIQEMILSGEFSQFESSLTNSGQYFLDTGRMSDSVRSYVEDLKTWRRIRDSRA